MELNNNWLTTSLEITGGFETDGNPWAGVSGDFDAEGISCGILQWNIGQGSLQPLVKAVGKDEVIRLMPVYGKAFFDACSSSITQGLATVRSWQSNKSVLHSDAKTELQALMGSMLMKEQQLITAKGVGKQAMSLASEWAADVRGSTTPTLHEFCWFFDLVTQNGGLKGVGGGDVKAFIQQHAPDKADNVICEWLGNAPSNVFGFKDARKNAIAWCDNISAEALPLFVLSYLRAQKSRSDSRYLVLNRKGTIAITSGMVNGDKIDLSSRFS